MAKKKDPTFEERLAELEQVVRELDAEDLPLEHAIQAYERGVKLSMTLNQTLEEAQQKIEILTQSNEGELEAKPFEKGSE